MRVARQWASLAFSLRAARTPPHVCQTRSMSGGASGSGGSVVATAVASADSPTLQRGAGERDRSEPSSSQAHRRSPATPGKVRRVVAAAAPPAGGGAGLRVRRRDPWGLRQLRDSWSEDAMTKRETENMSERIHREYRYHPDEHRRHHIKYTALLSIPLMVLSWGLAYYYHTGRPPWAADPQHLLNLIRAADTSPRSKLYLYRLPEMEKLPDHVLAYRARHAGEREFAERAFKVTHSATARLTEDDLRRMEMELELALEEEEDAARAA